MYVCVLTLFSGKEKVRNHKSTKSQKYEILKILFKIFEKYFKIIFENILKHHLQKTKVRKNKSTKIKEYIKN